MSPAAQAVRNAIGAIDADRAPEPDGSSDFGFLPKSLTLKCRQLIETYHGIHGYSCLPDLLWHPEVRNFIEMRKDFGQIFKRAATIRSAKKANESYVLIATTILAVEVLACGFASWGMRFPAAKRKAHMLLSQYSLNSRTCLMDRYLYPRSYISPAFINALAPPDGLPRPHRPDDSSRPRVVDIRDTGADDAASPGEAHQALRDLVDVAGHATRFDAA
jgi:hypothetical protein